VARGAGGAQDPVQCMRRAFHEDRQAQGLKRARHCVHGPWGVPGMYKAFVCGAWCRGGCASLGPGDSNGPCSRRIPHTDTTRTAGAGCCTPRLNTWALPAFDHGSYPARRNLAGCQCWLQRPLVCCLLPWGQACDRHS
jgi:hypothetical protein